jgi:hypothetical protein
MSGRTQPLGWTDKEVKVKEANSAAVNWNRNNASDPICVYTADMTLAGISVGTEKCGLEAKTLFAGGYAACISHIGVVRAAMRDALNGKAVR